MNDPHLPSDTEILISRVLHAPRELVWEAWTNPRHVVNWWGPRGFTNTTKRFEFHVGGYWEHTMHGPDGANYPNKCKFLEIVPLERITYLLGGGSDLEDDERRGVTFRATWTFEVVDAQRTRLTGRMVFQTKEARDRVVRDYGAVEGGQQTLERAAEYVAGLQSEPYVLAREFAAPRELVWRMWTEGEHFARWFGPKDGRIEMLAFDLRPGGMNHYRLTMPNGAEMWGRAVYREIVPPQKLVWMNAFSDAAGGLTVHPMSPNWPKEMLTTVTFAGRGERTLVTVEWLPFDATEIERTAFSAARPGMAGGWGGTFDRFTAYLADAASRR